MKLFKNICIILFQLLKNLLLKMAHNINIGTFYWDGCGRDRVEPQPPKYRVCTSYMLPDPGWTEVLHGSHPAGGNQVFLVEYKNNYCS